MNINNNTAKDFFKRLFKYLDLSYSIKPYNDFKPSNVKERYLFKIRDNKHRYNRIQFSANDENYCHDDIMIDIDENDTGDNDFEYNILKFLIDRKYNTIIGESKDSWKYDVLFSFPMFDTVAQAIITLDTMVGR